MITTVFKTRLEPKLVCSLFLRRTSRKSRLAHHRQISYICDETLQKNLDDFVWIIALCKDELQKSNSHYNSHNVPAFSLLNITNHQSSALERIILRTTGAHNLKTSGLRRICGV